MPLAFGQSIIGLEWNVPYSFYINTFIYSRSISICMKPYYCLQPLQVLINLYLCQLLSILLHSHKPLKQLQGLNLYQGSFMARPIEVVVNGQSINTPEIHLQMD